MADGCEWSFAHPPDPGVDSQYDTLLASRREAEDRDEALRIELAISILLLGRNYDLSPEEYTRIFDFGDDQLRLRSAQESVSALIARQTRAFEPAAQLCQQPAQTRECGPMGRLASHLSSWAVRVKSLLSFLPRRSGFRA
jgi:hypothetical protein